MYFTNMRLLYLQPTLVLNWVDQPMETSPVLGCKSPMSHAVSTVILGTLYKDLIVGENVLCAKGFIFLSTVRTCLPAGTWSGSEASCVPLECDELIPPDNAVIILPCRQTFRASCVIQCNDGYFIPAGSPSTQRCELTANGTVEWSPPPICLREFTSHTYTDTKAGQ